MKTVKEYCDELMWNATELSRQAGLSWRAASNAVEGRPIQWKTKRDVCRALTEAVGRPIKFNDVQWELPEE